MYKNVYAPHLWYMDVFSVESSKKLSLEWLRREYGFDKVVGFGDQDNDIPLFQACDVRVAVGNANDNIKSLADHICDTNQNDGVVRWMMENT